jgi:hypothetical protein
VHCPVDRLNAPMMRPPDDLRGDFHADADDTAYPDVEALVTSARRRVVASRRRRLAGLCAATAAAAVVGVLVTTQSTHLAVRQPAGRGATTPAPSATPTPTASPTSSPTVTQPPSQSAGDARVYGIDPAIAALPIGVRVLQLDPAIWPVATTQASTPEGLWLVSYPYASAGVDLAAHPQLTVYGELLLMTPDRSRILSAYPFRDVPPQWLLVTPHAVYCGRQGDGGVPNSMACRVDRSTGALTVVVFPSPDDFATDAPPVPGGLSAPRALAGRPGSWRLASSLTSAFLQRVPRLTANGLLFAPDPSAPGGGKSLRLDPVTLK